MTNIDEEKRTRANRLKRLNRASVWGAALAIVFLTVTFFYPPLGAGAAGIKYERRGVAAARLASTPPPAVSSDDVIAPPPTL
jgi:hypothetical protein